MSDPVKYDIVPLAKPRMTQQDKWKKRPSVIRYRAYCDELRRLGVQWRPWDGFIFRLPMPGSWTLRKKEQMMGQPHEGKPDLDNLIKGVWDALYPDSDAHCHALGPTCKIWASYGSLIVVPRPLLPHEEALRRETDGNPFPPAGE